MSIFEKGLRTFGGVDLEERGRPRADLPRLFHDHDKIKDRLDYFQGEEAVRATMELGSIEMDFWLIGRRTSFR